MQIKLYKLIKQIKWYLVKLLIILKMKKKMIKIKKNIWKMKLIN